MSSPTPEAHAPSRAVALGFWRARLDKCGQTVLERAHHKAVCAGACAAGTVPENLLRPQVLDCCAGFNERGRAPLQWNATSRLRGGYNCSAAMAHAMS